jgi:N-acetylglucosamine kinase-like BadF-type ATPase
MEKKQVLHILAENMRRHMYQEKLSVLELSRICNVSAGTISKIMNSKMSVTVPMAMNLAAGLKINLDELLQGLSQTASKKKPPFKTKNEFVSIGILSINNKRMTCIKNQDEEVIGQSELCGGLDLAESSSSLLALIDESIETALKLYKKRKDKIEVGRLNLVTQSYEFEDSRQRFINFARKYFKEILLYPDWKITYFADFKTDQGICLIADKGVSLSYQENGDLNKLGGWKFPVYDLGGVNWLGMKAIQHTIEAVEGTIPMTPLANSIITNYNGKIERITETCFKANKDHDVFSEFAEPLLKAYYSKEAAAKEIIDEGFKHMNRLIENVDRKTGKKLKIAIHGSLAPIYSCYFNEKRLLTPATDEEKAYLLADLSEDKFRLTN